MFSQILDSLNDCKRGVELFSRENQIRRHNWKRVLTVKDQGQNQSIHC